MSSKSKQSKYTQKEKIVGKHSANMPILLLLFSKCRYVFEKEKQTNKKKSFDSLL